MEMENLHNVTVERCILIRVSFIMTVFITINCT